MCNPTSNPFLQPWDTPFEMPPFDQISPSHYKPAFEEAMKEHLSDLKAIAEQKEEPDFENTIAAYDRTGSLLSKVSGVFSNMCSSLNTDELKEVQTEMVPILSRHSSSCYTLPFLFERIANVKENESIMSTLTLEQKRLVDRIYMDFKRQGAHFDEEQKKEYADIKAQLASLSTKFMQNLMKDEESYEIVLKKEDMDGCPDSLIEAARQAASERGKAEDEYVITLSRSLVEPFLTYANNRALREKAFREWTRRGELSDERANLPLAVETLKLRKRQAEMHGYKNFAEYQCEDRMAKTPENVSKLLENVWERARASANREREALEAYCEEIGEELEGGIQGWDWRYYAEKVRANKYDFDASLLRPYLSLEKVTEALFAVSNNLFGLKYVLRPDIKSYHPDVKTYEVRETLEDGTDKLVALFIADNYMRPNKSSGAWMSEYRGQTKNLAEGANEILGVPIISNNNNFAKGSGPTLLSFDDAETLVSVCTCSDFVDNVSYSFFFLHLHLLLTSFSCEKILKHNNIFSINSVSRSRTWTSRDVIRCNIFTFGRY